MLTDRRATEDYFEMNAIEAGPGHKYAMLTEYGLLKGKARGSTLIIGGLQEKQSARHSARLMLEESWRLRDRSERDVRVLKNRVNRTKGNS